MTDAWHHADTHRLLSAADHDTVTDATRASHQLDAILQAIPATLAAIRDSANGQPRAATNEPSHAAPTAWCWTHERELHACLIENLNCAGDVIDRPSDPVGEAAITDDRSSAHRNETIGILRRITRDVRQLHAIVGLYPSASFEPEKPTGPGVDWCISCWRDAKHHEPITQRPDGGAFYAGKCRWCGQFEATNGFPPPVGILELRHRGERITTGMVDEARKEHRAKAKKSKKSKTRSKR